MKLEIINGRVTKNTPSNEKKIKFKSQEIPIEIDNPDNSIPQLSTSKDMLKIISGKIDVVNCKIDFIVRQFIPD